MNDRLYQVWYVYDDGREGCMSRLDEPMTHEHALRFRKGCMQGVKGRRLELREVGGLVARETERRFGIWVGYEDGREGYLNRPDKPLTYEEAARFTQGMPGVVEGRRVEIREIEI